MVHWLTVGRRARSGLHNVCYTEAGMSDATVRVEQQCDDISGGGPGLGHPPDTGILTTTEDAGAADELGGRAIVER